MPGDRGRGRLDFGEVTFIRDEDTSLIAQKSVLDGPIDRQTFLRLDGVYGLRRICDTTTVVLSLFARSEDNLEVLYLLGP